jgi:uncharacterized protein YoxC
MEIIVNEKIKNATLSAIESTSVVLENVIVNDACTKSNLHEGPACVNINQNLQPVEAKARAPKKPYKSSHNPQNPRIFKTNDKLRYHSIEQAKRNLFDSYLNPFKYQFGELFFHKDKKGRKVRSEQCESLATRVGAVLWHYMDLITFQFGMFKNNNQFHYYDYGLIQQKLGASESQVRRTMERLQDTGYVTVIPIREIKTGKDNIKRWKTTDVIITLTDKFISAMGLNTERLLTDRGRALDKYNERQTRIDKKKEKLDRMSQAIKRQLEPVKETLEKVRNLFQRKRKPSSKTASDWLSTVDPNQRPQQNRKYIDEALTMFKDDDSRPISDYLDEIIKKYQSPSDG